MWLLSSILDRANIEFFLITVGSCVGHSVPEIKFFKTREQGFISVTLSSSWYGEFTCSCMYCLISFLIGKPTF